MTAKEKALIRLCDINVDHNWWEFTYDDAKDVGIKIKTFDLYRGELDADFLYSMDDIANRIMFIQGSSCETYILSSMFLKSRDELVAKYSDGINLELVLEDNFEAFDEDLDDFEQDYQIAIKCAYLSILDHLKLINVLYREDFDSEVQEINFVEEDLYDEQSNSVLQSIVLLTDNSDI